MELVGVSRQYCRVLLANDVLRSTGNLRLCARGTSMLPTIWPGDILNVQRCEAVDLKVGDLVLVSDGDRFVAHRVVVRAESARGLSWVTRGDAMPQKDQPSDTFEIVGKILSIDRRGQHVVPMRKRSLANRGLGFVLSRSRRLLNLTLLLRQTLWPELCEETPSGGSAS